MRTPGHAVVNLAVLRLVAPDATAPVMIAVVAGAVVPDLPIVCLYLLEKARGTPTPVIWRDRYQQPFWKNLIHGLHAFPFAAAGFALCAAVGFLPGAAFCASMLGHALLDLPIHGEDAHRHLLPISHWRFVSPLSYWDVTRHARAVTAVEWLLVAGCSAFLGRGAPTWVVLALVAINVGYLGSVIRLYLAPEPAP